MEKNNAEERGWRARLTLEVKGPKEGPITATIDYPDTTREVATGLQDALAMLSLKLNKEGF